MAEWISLWRYFGGAWIQTSSSVFSSLIPLRKPRTQSWVHCTGWSNESVARFVCIDVLVLFLSMKSSAFFSKASTFFMSAFLFVQVSAPYVATGKTSASINLTFVSILTSLHFHCCAAFSQSLPYIFFTISVFWNHGAQKIKTWDYLQLNKTRKILKHVLANSAIAVTGSELFSWN